MSGLTSGVLEALSISAGGDASFLGRAVPGGFSSTCAASAERALCLAMAPLCSCVVEARHHRHAEHERQHGPAQEEALSTRARAQLQVHPAAHVDAELEVLLQEVLCCQLYTLQRQEPGGKSGQGMAPCAGPPHSGETSHLETCCLLGCPTSGQGKVGYRARWYLVSSHPSARGTAGADRSKVSGIPAVAPGQATPMVNTSTCLVT